jgi:hypothetical protein
LQEKKILGASLGWHCGGDSGEWGKEELQIEK